MNGRHLIAQGINASPGWAGGIAVFNTDRAERLGKAGQEVILIRPESEPDDVHGLLYSRGMVTSRGGVTSHAGVVCRGLGIPCVAGANIEIDDDRMLFSTSDRVVREGERIVIDGSSGLIYIEDDSGLVVSNTHEVVVTYRGSRDETTRQKQTDPLDSAYLKRYVSLLLSTNSDNYVDDSVGIFWLLRDLVKDRSKTKVRVQINASTDLPPEPSRVVHDATKYRSFIQPPATMIDDILGAMHWTMDPDTTIVIWSIMNTLVRLLQNEVGAGNHHLAIRPIIDPQISFVDLRTQSLALLDARPIIQLVGLEFFGINHFIRNYLEWGYVQWWITTQLPGTSIEDAWSLDRSNPQGESLLSGAKDLITFLVVLDGKCLTPQETRAFYNELRKRELGWDWYREHGVSRLEIVDLLKEVQEGRSTNSSLLRKCVDMGLVTDNLRCSSTGLSLLFEQPALSRRHITFAGRELQDE